MDVKRKTRWADYVLLFAALIFSLLIAEVICRAFLYDQINLFPRNHAAVTYGPFTIRRMVPNIQFWHQSADGRWQFRINNVGLRDDADYHYAKPIGQYRVLVLGDSHTEGFEVQQNETFSAILQQKLRLNGRNALVINAGVSGFGTAEELVFLENEGLRYKPDAVILAFFANDFQDNLKAGLYDLNNNVVTVKKLDHVPGVDVIALTLKIPGLKWLGENSYAYSLLFNFVWDAFKSLLYKDAAREYAISTSEPNHQEVLLTEALLRKIGEICRKFGIFSILVDIPQLGVQSDRKFIYPSLPRPVLENIASAFDVILPYSQYITFAASEAHMPHGQHHITPKTHAALATKLTENIDFNARQGHK